MSTGPADIQPFARLPRGLAPLGYRNFALYWVGFAASNTGKWIELTGSLWLIYALSNSPLVLGLLGLARGIPAIALGPIAGVIADRVDRRRALFFTQAMAMVSSLIVGVLVATGKAEVWHILLQAGIQAGIQAFDQGVRQALFPDLAPRAKMAEAVTLNVTAGRTSKFVGPAVGGVAIATLGTASPFLINAGTFLVLMAAVVLMRGVLPLARRAASFRQDLVDGFRHLWHEPILSGMLKLEIVFGIFQMNEVMITIIGREVLDVGPEGLGILLSAPALGSVVGVAALLTFGIMRRAGAFVIVCTMIFAAASLAVAVSRDFAIIYLALGVTGLFDSVETVTRQSVMQLAAPAHMRGRMMANMSVVTTGVAPLAQTQSGIVAGVIGAPLAVVFGAVALAAGSAVIAWRNRSLWTFSLDLAAVGPLESDSQPLAAELDKD